MTDRRSTWCAVALSRKVGAKPHRVLLGGQPFVLFRSGDGLHCLTDRCPHRFAPLSLGRVIDGAIECPYHGWRFDGGGHCRSMPGLLEQTPNIAVPAHAVREQNGLIYISPGRRRGEPYAGVLSGPGVVSRVVENRVRSTLLDVAENILDATHTHFTHGGLLRGLSSRRWKVRVSVTGGDGWVEARYEGEPRQEGLISRLLEGERSISVGRFIAPGIAELEFWGRDRINLSTTFHLRQEDDDHVRGFGVLAGPLQGGFGYIKALLFRPLFTIALRQDQRILNAARDNKPPGALPVLNRLDVLRSGIEAILRGERPPVADAPFEITMEL
ncbi:Rieske 2Fe-2S domain-containing protein [Bradyrhizobium manausense]|uniref:Rieske 2Fe-2S domain-containing protein n=1 Tax=Bradyrhizobium manausense TaxID=989370 RepID=UPI001BACDF80|nr:Rieske 2Fe-2S domain-containing protein [Bradyrhizobium manausense]MBR1089627.1 Rieske 2Fe-2S domain-containing protein [Bradyrhizobium manausense]